MSKLTSIRDRIKGPVFSILTPFNPNNDETISILSINTFTLSTKGVGEFFMSWHITAGSRNLHLKK